MNIPRKNGFVAPLSYSGWQTLSGDKVFALDRFLVWSFLHAIGDPELRVVLWNGEEIKAATAPNVAMVIHDRATLWRLLTKPLLNFGDDYSAGRIEIEGGLIAFLEVVYRSMAKTPQSGQSIDAAAYRRNQPVLNSLKGSRRNIHHHYDIGNDFYRLWLDQEMLYTCAYFHHQDASLEEAQVAKMDLVCRKLRLKAGQTVVEAGCGWGGLARYMAKSYGVKVRAYNISRQQIEYARHQVKLCGLEGQVEYVEDDYRNISGQYDVFVSVGMLEHVGPDHYHDLGRVINGCLKEHGTGLIHTIGQNRAKPMSPWFLQRIFPGSYPPTIREMMSIFEPWEFTVLDLENLRLHYAKTCEHWLQRFEEQLHQVREMFDEVFIRAWRLYLSGCIANFSIGSLQLFQILFSRHTNNQIPLTRTYLLDPVCEP